MTGNFGRAGTSYGSTIVAEVWSELEPAATRFLAEPSRRQRSRHRRRSVGLGVAALVIVRFFGSVQVKDAVAVRLEYSDGTGADVQLGAEGKYEFVLPVAAQAAFARTPGRLVALDRSGKELASRTVGAVSFWHRTAG